MKGVKVSKIIPVILSGGTGTRLWPLSRKQYPKQYLPLAGDNTMLQETILRLEGLDNLADPIIVCNVNHRFLVAEQCQQINISKPIILLEPIGRNTAPAIAAAALQALKQTDDVGLLVLSADHVVQDVKAFHQAIKTANKQVQEGKLAVFGIVPTDANTGYGYIKSTKDNFNDVCKVEEFVEKPDLETAQYYLEQDNYLWNSGMFMFKAGTLMSELIIHSPDIVQAAHTAIDNSTEDQDFIRMAPFDCSDADNSKLSIDYALMEKTDQAVVISLDAGWNDIGSWDALHKIGKKDINNNVIKGDVIFRETTNSYIKADHHMIATIGVDNLIVIDTPDAVLVASKDKTQKVKQIVEQLQQQVRCEEQRHRKVYRPWGWYDIIDSDECFQVKRINVKPCASLSLQKHYHRAEHWIIVKGVAKITKGNKTELLSENQSTYIPIGTIHRLENPSKIPLEMIEVQSGDYLGEDDIKRYKDNYGREK